MAREADIAYLTMWKILGNCPPVEGNEEIVITGQVLGDGRGDWAAIRNMQKTLQKKFPDRTVRIIASSAEKWNKPGLLDIKKIKALDLIFYKNSEHIGIKIPLSAFPEEFKIIEKVQKAGVVIVAGVDNGSVFKSVLDEIHEKSIKIKEQDFDSHSLSKKFGQTVLQTGIAPLSNRAGIFINKEKEYSWKEVENSFLKSIIFRTCDPTQKQIDDYNAKHECFFGYMHKTINTLELIEDAVTYTNAYSPSKSVDICLPGFCHNMHWHPSFNKGLADSGIGRLLLIWNEGSENKERIIDCSEDNINTGIEVRILDPGSMSSKDFKILTRISGPIVGCTGDSSLAQALSFGKIPCYEHRFRGKSLALLNRVQNNFGEESALYQYCTRTINHTHHNNLENINLSELVEQAKQLGKFMKEELAFQPILRGIVNEKLIRQKDKDFADRTDQLHQNFLDKKISISELKTQFTTLLAAKNLLQKQTM